MIKSDQIIQAFSFLLLLLSAYRPLAAQSYQAPLSSPFGLETTGNYSSPAVADLDGDGDGDVLAGFGSGDFAYFQNKGNAKAPFFAGNVVNPFGLSALPARNNPALVDLDGDGDFDLFCGSSNGLFYIENTGDRNNPQFAAALGNPFDIIPPQGLNRPEFADLDRDGDPDLFLAATDGNVYYFENTGDAQNPAFAAPVKNPFGMKGVGASAAMAFDRERLNPGIRVLICEGDTGHFYAYGEDSSGHFSFLGKDLSNLGPIGSDVRPVFYDLDDDGYSDVLAGNADGEFHLFLSSAPLGTSPHPEAMPRIYPNPAGAFLNIEGAAGSRIEVINLKGETLLQGSVQSSSEIFNLEGLPAGLYLIRIGHKGRSPFTLKILRL